MKKNRKKKKKQSKFIGDGLGLIIITPQPDGSTETIILIEEGAELQNDSTAAAESDPEPRADEAGSA